MTDPQDRPDVATLTYEQARDELIQVVTSLEHGTASLEDSLALWERGEALADRCQGWLDTAKERLAAASADRSETRGEDDHTGADQPAEAEQSERSAPTTAHAEQHNSRTPPGDDDGPPW